MIPEGHLSKWSLTRGKRISKPKPEVCGHFYVLSRGSVTILMRTLRILFHLFKEIHVCKLEIYRFDTVPGNIKSDVDLVIMPGIMLNPCDE